MSIFGKILSVNVGRAAPLLLLQGETIMSGFFKHPSRDAQRVEALGLTRDDHVDDVDDPDRAVLLYQRIHYDYWTRELGRALEPGAFGEQLTIDGPVEDEVWIGDQLQVGDVLLEVTQPRIPCRRMAGRFGDEEMPFRYLRSGRSGFFCKVLRPGTVAAGDHLELVGRGPEPFTVTDLAGVLHTDEPAATALERALASPVLPDLVRRKLTKLKDRMAAQATGWSGDRPLAVTSRTAHGIQVVAFELADPDGQPLPDFAPGQFLTLMLDVPDSPRPVVRTYTIAGRSADGHGYRVAIKREPAPPGSVDLPPGVGSGYMHDNVTVGSRIRARAPRGRFVLQGGSRPVVLISGGIGITPMVAMLEHLTRDAGDGATPADDREVYFVHAARSSRYRAFDQHVRDLLARSPRVHSYLVYDQPEPSDRPGIDFDSSQRLSADTLAEILPTLDADYYVCGPPPFMADIVSGLVDRGVPRTQLHYEFFGAATSLFGDEPADGEDAVDAQGRPIRVTFARSGLTVPWRTNTYSLLALAEQAGLRPEASCRTGLCGTCVCRIDDGEVEYVIDPMDGAKPGKVFVCAARPLTSVMIDL